MEILGINSNGKPIVIKYTSVGNKQSKAIHITVFQTRKRIELKPTNPHPQLRFPSNCINFNNLEISIIRANLIGTRND